MTDLNKLIDQNIGRIPDFPKEGILFKDISLIFQNPALCTQIVDEFVRAIPGKVDAVCGIESRGFLFGILIANKLNVPFIMVRKQGKLPPMTVAESYQLEYGQATIEIQPQYISPGMRVLIHDDVLATGGTAAAAGRLIQKCGGVVTQFSFILELDFLKGRDKLDEFSTDIVCLKTY